MKEVYKKNHKINKEFYIDSIIKFLAKKNTKLKYLMLIIILDGELLMI